MNFFCELCGSPELFAIADTSDERCVRCGHKQRHLPVPPGEQEIRGAWHMLDQVVEGNAFAGSFEAVEPTKD